MPAEPELNYICRPAGISESAADVEFHSIAAVLADEPACKVIWDLVTTQFSTRSKFLAIWPCVRFIALHRNAAGSVDGFLLVSAPVNWQIDYVVVHPDSRGQGIASKLVTGTVAEAAKRAVPYVMLTSKASLRSMYERCGFRVVPG